MEEEIPQEQISVVGENVGVGSEGVDLSTVWPLFTDVHGARVAWHSPAIRCNNVFTVSDEIKPNSITRYGK